MATEYSLLMCLYLIGSVLFKEWYFASIDKVHSDVVNNRDANIDEVNSVKVEMSI